MNNNLLQLKVQQRLNKLGSFDYENIECWMIVEAFNKAQLEWVRSNLHGNNAHKEGDEKSSFSIDDFQCLLKQIPLQGTQKDSYYETRNWPADFLKFKRVSTKGKTDCCPERTIVVYEAEEHNADILSDDDNTKPSFQWGETFCTRIGNKIRIYNNNEFTIIKPKLTYYRKPVMIAIDQCMDENGLATRDVPCEFKDDIVELIIDEAVSILAGDYENMTQYQRNGQNADKNN